MSPVERRLARLHARFAASARGGHIVALNDARKIFRTVRSCHARRALDLGTGLGASAAFIAAAMEKDGRVWSVEQDASYTKEAEHLMPQELAPKVHMSVSDAYSFTTTLAPGHTFAGYRTLPLHGAPFDFVLVDGPGSFMENGMVVRYPNGDLFNLLPYLALRCTIFIDRRHRSAALYEQFLGKYFAHIVRARTYSVFVYEKRI